MKDAKETITDKILERIIWCHNQGIETSLYLYGEKGQRVVKVTIAEAKEILDTEGSNSEKDDEN